MSKELEALENIKNYDTRVGLHEDDYKIIETALKRLATLEEEKQSFDRQLEKKLKALEIIKSFVYFDIIKVQGQWFLIQGTSFVKSLKLPITKEQAKMLKEVLL